MKHIIVGTAGHIDHGKTTLVRMLTGIDCDRLPEEKRRGITIELGFAYMKLSDQTLVGIVDVPGHERFIRHMVAGAGGMDLVILVVAADDGVNLQTREHLDILRLLDLKIGMTVITKSDLVDADWLELVQEDLKETLKGTFLEKRPIIVYSAERKTGIDKIRDALEILAQEVREKPSHGILRLPIDRVFTMKGFGSVVTGTLTSGKVKVGDTVEIMPQKRSTKVRGLQVHNEKVDMAFAGMRTAINLQGIERERIERGDVVVTPDHFEPSSRIVVQILTLPGLEKPIKNRIPLRFLHGTKEFIATPVLMDRDVIGPQETAFAQLILDEPLVAAYGDRFILRSYSPSNTVGGGIILEVHPDKYRRNDLKVLSEFKILAEGSLYDRILIWIKRSKNQGMIASSLITLTNANIADIEATLQSLCEANQILCYDKTSEKGRYVDREMFEGMKRFVLDFVDRFHARFPLRKGPLKEEIRSKLSVDEKLISAVISDLSTSELIVSEGEYLWRSTFSIRLNDEEAKTRDQIVKMYQESQFTPPLFKELQTQLSMEEERLQSLLAVLTDEGILVRVKESLYFDAALIQSLTEKLISHLKIHGEIAPSEFKELTGASRKFSIPLLEYYDAQKVTIRVGEKRILRKEN